VKRGLGLAAAVIALLTSACQRQDERKDELAAALYETESLSRSFSYEERQHAEGALHETDVRGVIVDDYRYELVSTLDGERLVSEVVVDDARALRAGKAATSTGFDAAVDRWFVDPKGANNLFPSTSKRIDDPVFDALEALRYVRRAMGEAAAVVKFNPESPDYRPKFDPFPRPEGDVARYDLLPPELTPRDPSATSGQGQVPGPRYFRRLSVYVSGGVVREVRERISVEDMLNDPRSRLAARIGDYGITLPENATVRVQADHITKAINDVALRLSQPTFRIRDLRVRFDGFGEQHAVELPAGAEKTNFARLGDVVSNEQILYETPG
jgi:hypothetical protein